MPKIFPLQKSPTEMDMYFFAQKYFDFISKKEKV